MRIDPVELLDDAIDELRCIERLGLEIEPTGVELAREQDLVHDPAEALRLVRDQRYEPVAAALVEREIVTQQRLSGAVDRGERRPQLVGCGRDEGRLQLLEPADVGQVAEGVDRAAEELDSGDRDPTLASLGLERDDNLGMSRI